MSNKKHLNRFFSRSNIEFLYSSISSAIYETQHYQIKGDEFKDLLKNVMKNVVENTPIEEQSLERLNKETSNKTARAIVSHLINEAKKRHEYMQQKEKQLSAQQRRNPNVPQLTANIPQLTVQTPPRPVSSYQNEINERDEDDYDEAYNRTVTERSENEDDLEIPNFQDPLPDPDTLPDVDSLYENAEYHRQTKDIISPPNSKDKERFKQTGVRAVPIKYEIPKPKQNANNQSQAALVKFNTSRSNQQRSPQKTTQSSQYHQSQETQQKMSTRISDLVSRPSTNKPNSKIITPPFEEPFLDLNNNENNDDQWLIESENDIRNDFNPQPPYEEMARLIPRTSRNIITNNDSIPHIYVVDSRDRDVNAYPSPSEYRVNTPEYKDVVSIGLESAEIPITQYVINEYNNYIHFQEESDVTQIATIPFGNYDSDELASAIENALNATSANGILYTVTNNTLTSKYTISSNATVPFIFNLLFFGGLETFSSVNDINGKDMAVYIENSIGPVIGFDKKNRTGALSYTSQFIYNLGGEKYIMLQIDEIDLIDANESSIHKSFAKLTVNVPLGGVKFFVNIENRFVKYFSPPLGKLSHLTIKFLTYDGKPYDFNGHDHSFTLRIITKDITKPIY